MFDYPIIDCFGEGQECDELRTENALIVTIRMNLAYAMVSLQSILFQMGFDPMLYRNRYIFYFFHLQSLLTACANISNACDLQRAGMRKNGKYDPVLYQEQKLNINKMMVRCGINKKRYPLIFDRALRNTTIHSDERILALRGQLGDFNIIDQDTPETVAREILGTTHLRTLDLRNMRYVSYKETKKEYKQISLDLNELKKEVLDLQETLKNGLFDDVL